MLAYILAIAVGLASLSLYLSAFFLPELHRKDDFLWSGVGLFYALVLWVCAGRITGGVLLGQSASVTLVLCFGWQTLRLRRAIANPDEKTDIRGFSFLVWLQNRFQKSSSSPVVETPAETETTEEVISESETPAETETTEEVISESETPAETETTEEVISESETSAETETTEEVISESETSAETETTEEVISESETSAETETTEVVSEVELEEETSELNTTSRETETPETKKQGFSFKSMFGRGKSQSQPTPEVPETDLEESNWDDDDEVSEMIEETEDIASEIVAETSEINQEESTENKTTEVAENLEEYVAEFEPYMADDDAETLIEEYKPTTQSSQSETTEKAPDQSLKSENDQEIEQKEEDKKLD
ncbi:Ycf66 family protein [Crocosphaera sp.]|uniref:Ycf66 family protein n=1 Tax=Crocosphaera sp. TaxID=2729996 RepID=UPI002628AE85|nr:Ycf66 family protein [Crocosphaera sp.]MDJ0580341.1 Ycf66 family protein [Crocosphaera sp.]